MDLILPPNWVRCNRNEPFRAPRVQHPELPLMTRHLLLTLLLLWALARQGQAQESKSVAPPAPAGPLQGGWNNQVANAQAAQWKAANSAAPGNAAVQLNWFRSEQNAMAGNNNGVLSPTDKTELGHIAGSIAATAPGSFEAHLAGYYMAYPAAVAFQDLNAAYQLAPDRDELLAPMLTKAQLEGDAAGLRNWSGEMLRRNAIAAPLQAAASDLLLSVEANGILFTNGDMDGQPAVVRQVQRKEKPTVLIVDQRLLTDRPYRERIWQQAGAKGPVPSAGPVFAQSLLTATTRPLYFALSLNRAWLNTFQGQLHAVGAAFRVGPANGADATALARNWAAMKKPLDAGPLSRNYLLPGAMLLAQYKAEEDYAKASTLEAELRRIAAATGATGELNKAGVLAH